MKQPILSVKNLSINYKVSYGEICAVKNISFDVERGESFVLVGRSGSGKSTVASALIDITDIDGGNVKSGEIFYRGKDILKMSFEQKREIRGKKISMIFQDPNSYLNPVMRINSQLFEAYKAHNPNALPEEVLGKTEEILNKVKLDDTNRILKSYPHQLSGGQKQRILIAMAIMNNPEILIADEPTTGLDTTVQKQVLDLIAELKTKMGLTLILITHNMRIANKYSDTIAVMHDGQIVEQGKTAEIFETPEHEYTKMLIEA